MNNKQQSRDLQHQHRWMIPSALLILVLGAMTVDRILQVAPIFHIHRQMKVDHVTYKTFDGNLHVQKVNVHRHLRGGGEWMSINDDDEGLFFYRKELVEPHALTAVERELQNMDSDIILDDDEGLFFYRKVLPEPSVDPTAIQRHLEDTSKERSMESVWPNDSPPPSSVANDDDDDDDDNDDTVISRILPALMVGIASIVIVCSILLYLTDLKDRCRHKRFLQEHLGETASKQNIRTTNSSAANSSSHEDPERWLQQVQVHPILPPIPIEDELDLTADQISLSRVSTMTNSLVGAGEMEDDIDIYQDEENMVYTSEATELSANHRVSDSIDLVSLVRTSERQEPSLEPVSETPTEEEQVLEEEDNPVVSPARTEISCLTESSRETEETPQLQGETVLKDEVTPKKKNITPISLEFSPDTPLEERDPTDGFDSREDRRIDVDRPDERAQLDHLIATIPRKDANGRPISPVGKIQGPPVEEYIRDIYYCPTASTQVDLGLQLSNATCPVTHPTIESVEETSPLIGRVFEGDFVLCVNGNETAGLTAEQVLQQFRGTLEVAEQRTTSKMVKLTIMSSRPDGASDTDDTIETVDLDLCDSAIEV